MRAKKDPSSASGDPISIPARDTPCYHVYATLGVAAVTKTQDARPEDSFWLRVDLRTITSDRM